MRLRSGPRGPPLPCGGFTLLELLIAIAILGLLAAIALPRYMDVKNDAMVARAMQEIRTLEIEIQAAAADGTYPASLSAIGRGDLRDPWGNPYRYLRIEGGSSGVPGQSRKDRFLVPINTDFDLYSMGPDGASRPPLTAQDSRDDIVRGSSGGYVGPATGY